MIWYVLSLEGVDSNNKVPGFCLQEWFKELNVKLDADTIT